MKKSSLAIKIILIIFIFIEIFAIDSLNDSNNNLNDEIIKLSNKNAELRAEIDTLKDKLEYTKNNTID